MINKKTFTIFIVLIANNVYAASGGHGSDSGIPTIVWWQLANVVTLFIGLIYIGKKSTIEFFKGRAELFKEQFNKSQAIKKEAEAHYSEIKQRLDKLNATSEESILRAKAEALDLQKNILTEAEIVAKRIKDDAQRVISVENNKAKVKIATELIKSTIHESKQMLQSDLADSDHKNLQNKFINQVGV